MGIHAIKKQLQRTYLSIRQRLRSITLPEDVLKGREFEDYVEKPREFDPRGQATMTPAGKNTLTLCGIIKMTPENDCFSGAFL